MQYTCGMLRPFLQHLIRTNFDIIFIRQFYQENVQIYFRVASASNVYCVFEGTSSAEEGQEVCAIQQKLKQNIVLNEKLMKELE